MSSAPASRVVIVGAGLMGRWHLDAARHAGARIVGVVDRDGDRAAALGGRALARPSLSAALEAGADVVHICTPLESHESLCREALLAGCHVIVEKPATATADDAVRLSKIARDADRILAPVHQFVYQRGVQRIRQALPSLGTIRRFEFAVASAGGDESVDRDGVAAEITPHAMSLARALLGVQTATLNWRLERPLPGEWQFSAVTDGGVTITGLISLGIRPTFARCSILAEGGSAVADLFHGYATFERAHQSRRYKLVRPMVTGIDSAVHAAANLAGRAFRGERAYPGLRPLCAATYAAIAGTGPTPFADDELVDVARARDRLLELAAR